MLSGTGKRIAVDLDGTLSMDSHVPDYMNKTPNEVIEILSKMEPNQKVIDVVNKLHANGNLIYIYTARNDVFQQCTVDWLKKHGVKYEYLVVNKEYYDYFLEDKAIHPEEL